MTTISLLSHKPLIDRYFFRESSALSAFSFVNLFSWKDFFRLELHVLDRHLCIFARNDEGAFMYLPPLGTGVKRETIDECFDMLEQMGSSGGIARIENVPEYQLALYDRSVFQIYHRGYEQCYYRKDLVGLRGCDYKAKRASYNYFVKHYRFEYVPYLYEMFEECCLLYHRWASERKLKCDDDIYVHMIDENVGVHRLVLQHYQELGLIGRVVRVNDEIRGYTFGYYLNDEIFCVLFEIVEHAVKGLPVFLFREFCCDPEVKRARFINVMDDFMMDNVGRTKMSFRPSLLLASYTVNRKMG